jgi:uncharacterized membrane protein
MMVFHFCLDLATHGLAKFDFSREPLWGGWQSFRAGILTLFLCVAGASLYLAHPNRVDWVNLLRRLGWLVGAAVLVTVATEIAVPGRTPWMGMLQSIALMTILALPFRRWGPCNLVLGLAAIAAGAFVSSPVFNRVPLQAVGLMTYAPETEDYVPLLPWFGVFLIGLFWGQILSRDLPPSRTNPWWIRVPPMRLLAWAGRHSLVIYLIHQPVFIGTLLLLSGGPPQGRRL